MSVNRFDITPILTELETAGTVITPNNRTVNLILDEFAATRKDAVAWERPKVYAVDIWLQELFSLAAMHGIEPFTRLRLLDRFGEQCVWHQLLKTGSNKYPLLNLNEAAAETARSYRLYRQWFLDKGASDGKHIATRDFNAFLAWTAEFESYCGQQDVISLSDAAVLLCSQIQRLAGFLPDKLTLVNFTQPPPLYAGIFDQLAGHCRITRIPDTEQEPADLPDLDGSARDISRHVYGDLRAEIRACVSWSLQTVQEKSDRHVAIIISGSEEKERLLAEEFHNQQGNHESGPGSIERPPYNLISGSQSLADSKLVNFSLRLLELNHERIEAVRFCRLMQSPQIPGYAEESESRCALEPVLRKRLPATTRLNRIQQIISEEGRAHHCPVLSSLLPAVKNLNRRSGEGRTMEQWIVIFHRQLQLFAWPWQALTESERRDIAHWERALDQLACCSSLIGRLNFAGAYEKLNSLLAQTPRHPGFDRRLPISVMNLEEAQDFRFDRAWLLEADDRLLPGVTNPASFIPISLQQQYALPGSSPPQQLDKAKTLLHGLAENTGQLIVSHHQYQDDLKLRVSPLLAALPLSEYPAPPASTDSNPTSGDLPEQFQEPLTLPLRHAVSGGSSLLNDQSNCPFKAFAHHRLNVSPLTPFEQGLSPMARGTALHIALERAGNRFDDLEQLLECDEPHRLRLIAESVSAAIDYLGKHFPDLLTPAFRELEEQRIGRLLKGFLEYESGRHPFEIIATERELTWTCSELTLNFRIDRIDRIEDGNLVVLDYKSGRKTGFRWYDDRPDDLQLPLYQLALATDAEPVVATLIYQINIENTGLVGPNGSDAVRPGLATLAKVRGYDGNWEQLQQRWHSVIHGLATEFEDGLLAVAPTRGSQTCQYCELASLCRIDDSQSLAAAGNETAS